MRHSPPDGAGIWRTVQGARNSHALLLQRRCRFACLPRGVTVQILPPGVFIENENQVGLQGKVCCFAGLAIDDGSRFKAKDDGPIETKGGQRAQARRQLSDGALRNRAVN